MELVYLWVEDYKNIRNQGFNFSPKFKCDYDENTKELTINENKEYVSIFPENINITAIVGENGSGKSSLIEIIFKILFSNEFRKNRNEDKNKSYLLIFQTSSGNKFYTNNQALIKNIEKKYSFIEKEELLTEYYLLMDFSLGQNPIYNSKENYKVNFSLEPSRISMTKSSKEFLGKIESNAFNNNMKVNAIFFYYVIQKYKLEDLLEKLNLPHFEVLNFLKPASYSVENKEEQFDKFKKDKIGFLNYKFETISNYIELEKMLRLTFKNVKIIDLTDQDIKEFEKMFYFMSLEIKNDIVSFETLSTGQKLLISYFGIIIRTILSSEDKASFSIIFDEVENSLHPKWQKYFIKYLVLFLTRVSSLNITIKNYKLVFLTHSPFILSDIPKENVIFLEKGKQVYPFEDGQTFGANIHTLLSHGFFMSDGLMGEFAKGKIEEIRKFYELVKKSEKIIKESETVKTTITNIYQGYELHFRHIQSIIGEPFLNTIMKNYLDELEQMFSTEDYKKAKKEELLKQFSKEELKAYLDEISD